MSRLTLAAAVAALTVCAAPAFAQDAQPAPPAAAPAPARTPSPEEAAFEALSLIHI